ncbi:hypothetical protein EVAR_65267_1 [Eumeta japonica]|uniref:Uncharacterized protein n=1 Tax=Eumeta variegata TaxID=151549 RepID=A0A4C1ZAX0_EUMVA|nr:hypothetical protein EVAR_65267_1 [Eumeta japonica]
MQAARHRGHHGRAECTGTAAPGVYRTLKTDAWGPRRSERLPRRGPERKEQDTGSLTRAWLSRAPPPRPRQPPLHNLVPPPAAERMRNDARAPAVPACTGLKIEEE